jgi:hypothetical protein
MDDEDIRKDFLISVDKFVAALESSDEALAAFNTFWQGLNQRLHAAPRSKDLYKLADETALAIATAAESLIATEEALKKNTDMLYEEAHFLGNDLQSILDDEEDFPSQDQAEDDWKILRDWFLTNIAWPFVTSNNISILAGSHDMDLDECDHWINLIRTRSSWQSFYSSHAANSPLRMQNICERFLPTTSSGDSSISQQRPSAFKNAMHKAFHGMRDSVVKAWADIWQERQQPPDWLEEIERRIALIPTDEEMEALGWDDESEDFDWDALERLRNQRLNSNTSPVATGTHLSDDKSNRHVRPCKDGEDPIRCSNLSHQSPVDIGTTARSSKNDDKSACRSLSSTVSSKTQTDEQVSKSAADNVSSLERVSTSTLTGPNDSSLKRKFDDFITQSDLEYRL